MHILRIYLHRPVHIYADMQNNLVLLMGKYEPHNFYQFGDQQSIIRDVYDM